MRETVALRPPWGGAALTFAGGPAEAGLFADIAAAGGRYGGGVLHALPELLPPDGIMVDAGAHVGLVAVPAAALVPGGRVHALEPVPATADLLAVNAAGHPAVTVHRIALSDHEGEAAMDADAAFSAGSSIAAAGALRVPVRTLDAWAEDVGLGRLDVLKLDVEGAEVAALRGARRTLARLRPALIVECNPPALLRQDGRGVRALHEELVRTAPHVVWLGRGGSRRRVPDADALIELLRRHGVGDVLATPRPLRSRVRPRAVAGAVAERLGELRPGAARFVTEAELAVRALSAPPARMAPGEEADVEVEVRNTGPHALSGVWRAHPVRLASRWHAPDGRPVAEGPRAPLPDPLPPGAAARRTVRVVAPAAEGPHELVVSGVQEHYAWLDAHGPAAAVRWPVEVAPGS